MNTIDPELWTLCRETPLVDTHEHLLEERRRVECDLLPGRFPCDDWSYLLFHYYADDLAVAGMPSADRQRLFAPDTPLDEKARLFLPWWSLTKHTGYGQAVRRSVQALYGEDDLTAESLPRLAEKYRALVGPGFYRKVLVEKGNLIHAQVNSLEKIFCKTAQPELLAQDLSFFAFTLPDVNGVVGEFGGDASTLDGWLAIIDNAFETCAPGAVAVKNQIAYARRLDFAEVSRERAESLWTKESRTPDETKDLQDFLVFHCVRRATERGLPVKLHTGYYAGSGNMPLARVAQNPADLVPLIKAFPDTTFVLMHIAWPYQDALLALAKHYRNVVIDLCWAWIINPAASTAFVREFLLTAPAGKLLPFGGDYLAVECVVGHASIARQGIAQALSELVAADWIGRDEAKGLIPQLFWCNARRLFPSRPGIWDLCPEP